MDIFRAFPNAISASWELGSVQKATEIGDIYQTIGIVDVIVDEGSGGQINMTPNADEFTADTLIYARPEQMPAKNPNQMISGYLFYNLDEECYYEITAAGVGRNQETGEVEHFEFKVQQTEAHYERS